MTQPSPNQYGIDDVALQQRIAELGDTEFAALVSRTRPHMPTEAEQRRAEQTAKAGQLLQLRAESDAHAAASMAALMPAIAPAEPSHPSTVTANIGAMAGQLGITSNPNPTGI